jgi:hypothetical protein
VQVRLAEFDDADAVTISGTPTAPAGPVDQEETR